MLCGLHVLCFLKLLSNCVSFNQFCLCSPFCNARPVIFVVNDLEAVQYTHTTLPKVIFDDRIVLLLMTLSDLRGYFRRRQISWYTKRHPVHVLTRQHSSSCLLAINGTSALRRFFVCCFHLATTPARNIYNNCSPEGRLGLSRRDVECNDLVLGLKIVDRNSAVIQ